MSWLYSRALLEEYSGDIYSGGERCAPLSVMPTEHKFSHRDKTTDHSQLSRYGVMCAVLTESHGEALLTSYLEASRARISALPERALVSRGIGPASGEKWHASFAKFDPDSYSWKTSQHSLLGGLTEFSGIWPTSGLMRNGECWERMTVVPPIFENDYGLLPTPSASSYGSNQGGSAGRVGPVRHSLDSMARNNQWPTVKKEYGKGQLNPSWVEWLMGWPEGWTSLDPLPMGRMFGWEVDYSSGFPDEPDTPRVTKGMKHRIERLRCLGNGQVPLCAAVAFSQLCEFYKKD